MTIDLKEINRRMDASIQALQKEFSGLRTGRASVALLDNIMVDAYGSKMPLNQVATVSVPDARMLSVQVWDASMAPMVEKAIRESDLGLNPAGEGAVVRVPVPPLSEERRREMTKVAGKYAENTRISIRNVRRDGMDSLKKAQKDGDISEDEQNRLSKEIQTLTDKHIQSVDALLESKDQEIMQV